LIHVKAAQSHGGKKEAAEVVCMISENSPESAPTPKRRRRQNLEFDFVGLTPSSGRKPKSGAARPAVPAPAPATTPAPTPAPAVDPKMGEAPQARTISAADAAAAAARAPVLAQPRPVAATSSPAEPEVSPPGPDASGPIPQPRKKSAMNQPNPTPITARRSIERQEREQRAIGTLLQGAGLALISSILVVAGLAALGGYVLYKQLQDQSASLALLEQNTKQRLFELEMDLTRRDAELAKNLEQSNLRLTALTSQFEEHRYQTTQTLSELRARNRELERQLSLYQKKVNDQQSIIARLR
jgi:hypothetical protein